MSTRRDRSGPAAPAGTGEPPIDTRAGDRIAKLLARAGVASRREVERMIAEGRVARGGTLIDTPNTVLSSLAGVTVDGNPVGAAAPAQLFLYHKPAGLLVTERDPRGRTTIYDRLPAELPRVVPVGRLDLATEGLLLLTTDGGLKRQLELPATGVPRTYRARAYGPVTQAQLEELIGGVEIDGIRYGSIDANLERRTGTNVWIELTLTEGKNREVRRVLEHLGLQVGRLIRTRYGPFVLGDLPPGEVGEVRQHDLVAFRQTLAGKRAASAETIAPMPLRPPRGGAEPTEAPRPRPATAPSRPRGEGAAGLPRSGATGTGSARDRDLRQPTGAKRQLASASPRGRSRGPAQDAPAANVAARSAPGRQRTGQAAVASARDSGPAQPERFGGAKTHSDAPAPPTSSRYGRSANRPDRDETSERSRPGRPGAAVHRGDASAKSTASRPGRPGGTSVAASRSDGATARTASSRTGKPDGPRRRDDGPSQPRSKGPGQPRPPRPTKPRGR